MASNVIIFDSAYTTSQVKNLENAKSLIEAALTELKNASAHEGWRCYESRYIEQRIDEIKNRLTRVNSGITSTGNILTQSAQSFSELENRSSTQANQLSNDLNNKYGFSNTSTGSTGSNLPVTQVPQYDTGTQVHPNFNTNNNGKNVSDDFAASIVAGMIEAGRIGAYLIGSTLGSFFGGIGGAAKGAISSLGLIDKAGEAVLDNKAGEALGNWGILKAGVSGAFNGVDGAFQGDKKGREIALKIYEAIFGKSDKFSFLNSEVQSATTDAEIMWGNIKNGIKSFPIIGEGVTSTFNIKTN